jgi:Fic family protein
LQSVVSSIKRILNGEGAADVFEADLSAWYQALFAPHVSAGLLNPSDTIGYRSSQVYIQGSRHTPLSPGAVREAMPVLFELLKNEPKAAVRAILGHFMFVYIHPYMDGNGRIARFLLNTQLISGGYPWVTVPVERRQDYMNALEKASADGEIDEFAEFIQSLFQ